MDEVRQIHARCRKPRIVYSILFIRLVAGFLKKHMHPTIDECHLTRLYVEKEKIDKKEIPQPRGKSSSDATEKSKNTPEAEISNRSSEKKNAHRDGSDHQQGETRVSAAALGHGRQPQRSKVAQERWK